MYVCIIEHTDIVLHESTSEDANTLGLIAGVASVDWGLAIQIGAAASIGSDMMFTPSTAQT